jgi:hypothetical protein
MENQIYINDKTYFDLATLLKTRMLIQANSGGGKSWAIRRILEQSNGKVQQIVIDLEGEFSSLREQYDYILIGKDGDTPADSKSAGLLAKRLLELQVSAIIDMSELPLQERRHFVRLFLEGMIQSPKELWHPCLVVIDEAHMFCPEKGQSEATDAVIALATLGRKRGFGCILATQRLSKLHKDASAECNNKLIGRTTQDIDIKRSAEELGISSKEERLSLRNLKPGEFFAYGQAISQEVIKVKIGTVTTSHIEPGSAKSYTKPAPTTKIKAALKSLEDLSQEAEQEARTIEDYKNQISSLERQLQERRPETKGHPSKETIDGAIQQALKAQQQQFTKEKEKLILYANALRIYIKKMQESIKTIQRYPLPDIPYDVPLNEIFSSEEKRLENVAIANDKHVSENIIPHIQIKKDTSHYLDNAVIKKWSGKLEARPQEMFQYIILVYPEKITRKELAIKMGIAVKGGYFHRILQSLRKKGLVEIDFSNDVVWAKDELFA